MAHVVVLVLGDVGRSPRMQYHAESLSSLKEVSAVTLVGYQGEKTMIDIDGRRCLRESRFAPWEFKALKSIAIIHAGDSKQNADHSYCLIIILTNDDFHVLQFSRESDCSFRFLSRFGASPPTK
jgi:hypothetical protein